MKTQDEIINRKKIKTKWSKNKIPSCINGKNHKWKGGEETGICLKCGFDVFDNCYTTRMEGEELK